MASDDSVDFKDKKRKKELQQTPTFGHNFPLKHGCEDTWCWSTVHRSYEVNISGTTNCVAHFHPNWSKGTAGVRGTRSLNNGRYYWELQLSERIFGTSMMFGIGTEKTRLHADSFINLLGEDCNSWGLSHKGYIWHNGVPHMYTNRFKENTPTTIGILFNGIEGTLTYYKDGVCLGDAFTGLDKIKEPLYPIICSTAAKTEMTLCNMRRDFSNLQDRCRVELVKHLKQRADVKKLHIPHVLRTYLLDGMHVKTSWQQVDNDNTYNL